MTKIFFILVIFGGGVSDFNTNVADTGYLKFDSEVECTSTIKSLKNFQVQGIFSFYNPYERTDMFCIKVESNG